MKQHIAVIKKSYSNNTSKKQWRGIELLLCWSSVVATKHISDLINEARNMFANMIQSLSLKNHKVQDGMFSAQQNLSKQSDMSDQLVNYAYLLFVLHQLHQPAHDSVLQWLQQ